MAISRDHLSQLPDLPPAYSSLPDIALPPYVQYEQGPPPYTAPGTILENAVATFNNGTVHVVEVPPRLSDHLNVIPSDVAHAHNKIALWGAFMAGAFTCGFSGVGIAIASCVSGASPVMGVAAAPVIVVPAVVGFTVKRCLSAYYATRNTRIDGCDYCLGDLPSPESA